MAAQHAPAPAEAGASAAEASDSAATRGDFLLLFGEMASTFRRAPSPTPIWLEQVSLSGLAGAEAIAVMFGWTNRVIRTGEAALALDDGGFTAEASPLLRSMLEHAMALHWLRDQPADAFQVLVRARQAQIRKLQDAEDQGWRLSDETRLLMGEMLGIETEDSSRAADFLLATKHHAERYGHGSLYQAWLIETWSSHASLASANPYYEAEDGRDGFSFGLLSSPKEMGIDLPAQCVVAALVALDAYNGVLPDSSLTRSLADWNERLAVGLEAER